MLNWVEESFFSGLNYITEIEMTKVGARGMDEIYRRIKDTQNTLAALLSLKNRFVDSLIYLEQTTDRRGLYQTEDVVDVYDSQDITLHDLNQLNNMSYLLVYILLIGDYQSSMSETPAFLLNIMGVKNTMQEIFELVSLSWVKLISQIPLPVEIKNRYLYMYSRI